MALTVGLPVITISTGVAPQSATWTDDSIGDAESISFFLNAATTAPGILISAALTTQSTATFVSILRPVDSFSSSILAYTNVTSSGIYTLWPATFRQLKFTSTGLVTAAGGIPVSGAKMITV